MGADSFLQVLKDILHTFGAHVAPYLESASPSAIKWSGIFGVAAVFVAVYSLRRGGRKPRTEGSDLLDREGSTSTTPASNGASFNITQAVSRSAPSVAQKTSSTPSTISQKIQRRLKGVYKVTCSLSGVLFEETNPQALSTSVTLRPAAVEILQALVGICDVYFISRVMDDLGEEKVHGALVKASLVSAEGVATGKGVRMSSHKSLYCTTTVGCMAIVRQLEPDLHIENADDIVKELSRFVPRLLHVSSSGTCIPGSAANISTTTGLDVFFGTTA